MVDEGNELVQRYVEHCKIRKVPANSGVCKALQDPNSTDLDLHQNVLGEFGVLPLLDVIEEIDCYESMNFEGTGIRAGALLTLLEKLKPKRKLRSLDLSQIPLSTEAGRKLIELLSFNRSIMHLKYKDDYLREEIRKGIRRKMVERGAIKEKTRGVCLVFEGPSSQAKTSLCQKLSERYSIAHITTGSLLSLAGTAPGTTPEDAADARVAMERGEDVADDLLTKLLLSRLDEDDCAGGWILEGLPSKESLAVALTKDKLMPDHYFVSGDEAENERVREVRNFYKDKVKVLRTDTGSDDLFQRVVRVVDGTLKVLILGPPAAGKGTQGEMLASKHGLVHVSSGQLLRDAVSSGVLGREEKELMANGQLVPHETILRLVKERLLKPDCKERGWVLDGFPRTGNQAKALNKAGLRPNKVVVLETPDGSLTERVTGRRSDPTTGKVYHLTFNPPPSEDSELMGRLHQREDDNVDTLTRSLANYKETQEEVEEVYSALVMRVRGDNEIHTVFSQIDEHIAKSNKEPSTTTPTQPPQAVVAQNPEKQTPPLEEPVNVSGENGDAGAQVQEPQEKKGDENAANDGAAAGDGSGSAETDSPTDAGDVDGDKPTENTQGDGGAAAVADDGNTQTSSQDPVAEGSVEPTNGELGGDGEGESGVADNSAANNDVSA